MRSLLSVLAGIAALTVASFAIEAVVDTLLLWAFPQTLPDHAALSVNPWTRILTFTYRSLCVAAGGYITARIARRWPMRHSAAMGLTQAGLTIVAMLSPASSHASRSQWIATAILGLAAALAGGLFYKSRNLDERLAQTPESA